jgi:ribonucleoside-triphosphate reductase (formate)
MRKKEFLNQFNIKTELLKIEGLVKPEKSFREEFFKSDNVADVSLDSNANVGCKTLISYKSELPKYLLKLESLMLLHKTGEELYGRETADEMVMSHLNGDLYINDLTGIDMPYCYNFSTFDIALMGLPMFKDKISEPPKNIISFIDQVIQFSIYASNSVLGAVGLADILIVLAYYVDKPDAFGWDVVKQKLQSFVFACNQPYTRGSQQSGFYNVSVYCDKFLDTLLPSYTFPDGVSPKKETVIKLQNMLLEIMNETYKKTLPTFPIISACFNVDDDKNVLDTEYFEKVCKYNVEYAFINFYFGKTSTLSSCCRLRSDGAYFNQLGGGGSKIGSIGVISLNLPRLALQDDFSDKLIDLTRLAIKINNVKRHIIQNYIDLGALPLYTHYFMSLKTQYSTVGLVGINEMLTNIGLDILDKSGQKFVQNVQDVITRELNLASDTLGYPHNLEQVPAENSAIKLAQKDVVCGYNSSYDLYSNQFIPLTTNADMLDRIKLQGLFDGKMSGGSILHLNVEHKLDGDTMYNFLLFCAKKGVVYTGINYNLQKCINGHIVPGKHGKCEICKGEITDEFSRVVGFIVNTKNFHKIRREVEYPNRQFY